MALTHPKWHLPTDRFFDANQVQRRVAQELYESVADLPPHGHVDPRLLADESDPHQVKAAPGR
jgi:hypothetical protein